MRFPEFKYVELATDKVSNRNTIVEIGEVNTRLNQSSRKECYRSYYRMPIDLLEYVKKGIMVEGEIQHTVKGWDGEVYTDYLWMDIDDELEKALEGVRFLIGRLKHNYGIPPDTLRLYFSGAKGFHVGIDSRWFGLVPSRKLPQQCKKLAELICEGIKIDFAVYDRTRLFRLSGSINAKTGLYKIPLTATEIETLTVDEIKELAKKPREVEYKNGDDIIEGELADMVQEVEENSVPETLDHTPAIRKKSLHGTKVCLWRIMCGVDEGIRDECAIRLAADYSKKGMPPEICYSLLNAWNEHNRPPLDKSVITEKIASAYGTTKYDFGCNDHVLSAFCHEDCFLFRQKEELAEPIKAYTIEELIPIYTEYVKNGIKTKVQFSFLPKINKKMRGLRQGEVCILQARPGVGKSLIAQTAIHSVVRQQRMTSVMFSIEMPKEQFFERSASIESKWSTEAVEEKYLNDNHADIDDKFTDLQMLYVVDKAGLSLGDIQETIENIGDVGFVIVDYMSLVRAPGNNLYERTSYVARHLKEVAKETQTAILMLSQVSREGGDGTAEITLSMGRDSGAIEEAGDFVWGVWIDMESYPKGNVLAVKMLKGRRGGAGLRDHITFIGESVGLAAAEV